MLKNMEIIIYIWMIIVIIGFSVFFGYFAYNVFGWRFINQYANYKKYKKKIELKEEKETKQLENIIDILKYNSVIQKRKAFEDIIKSDQRCEIDYTKYGCGLNDFL